MRFFFYIELDILKLPKTHMGEKHWLSNGFKISIVL